jgi:uncharacterized damage-inducible protein DinB
MSVRSNLSQQLLTVWNGDPWYGPSSSSVFAGITADEALAHPLPGTHGIWEILMHMIAWTEETTSRVNGGDARTPARGDWPAVSGSTQDEWINAQKELLAARKALLEAIEKSHEESMHLPVPKKGETSHGPPLTRSHTVSGLAEHDVYHLGQISLLKKALKNPK